MKIKVCTGSACKDRFSEYILTRLKNDKERFNLDSVEIEESLCMGECKKGPNIKVEGNLHNYMNPAKASEFLFNTTKKKKKKKNNTNNDKK